MNPTNVVITFGLTILAFLWFETNRLFFSAFESVLNEVMEAEEAKEVEEANRSQSMYS